ncbi:MAG TPA: hypothetical protein VFG15_12830 [Amycolatopsis sp.]|nr:hypothetical protein [Amycolatopsis sp.]
MIIAALVLASVALVVAAVAVRVAFAANRRAVESRIQARQARAHADALGDRLRGEMHRPSPDPSVVAKVLGAVGLIESRR